MTTTKGTSLTQKTRQLYLADTHYYKEKNVKHDCADLPSYHCYTDPSPSSEETVKMGMGDHCDIAKEITIPSAFIVWKYAEVLYNRLCQGCQIVVRFIPYPQPQPRAPSPPPQSMEGIEEEFSHVQVYWILYHNSWLNTMLNLWLTKVCPPVLFWRATVVSSKKN